MANRKRRYERRSQKPRKPVRQNNGQLFFRLYPNDSPKVGQTPSSARVPLGPALPPAPRGVGVTPRDASRREGPGSSGRSGAALPPGFYVLYSIFSIPLSVSSGCGLAAGLLARALVGRKLKKPLAFPDFKIFFPLTYNHLRLPRPKTPKFACYFELERDDSSLASEVSRGVPRSAG